MLSGHLWAAEAYDINKSYPGGSQVNYNGQVFEAKCGATTCTAASTSRAQPLRPI